MRNRRTGILNLKKAELGVEDKMNGSERGKDAGDVYGTKMKINVYEKKMKKDEKQSS